jgi:formylglycine-generating enzyme required for sulfatase activity
MKQERSMRWWACKWRAVALVALLVNLLMPSVSLAQVQTFFVLVPDAVQGDEREAYQECAERLNAAMSNTRMFRANADVETRRTVANCISDNASASARRECELSIANVEVDWVIVLSSRRIGGEWKWGIAARSPAESGDQKWGGDEVIAGVPDQVRAAYVGCDRLGQRFACAQGVPQACVGTGFGSGPILSGAAAVASEPSRARSARAKKSALEVMQPTPKVVSVWIDGNEAGTSEKQIIGIPSGRHEVVLKALGYDDHVEQLNFAPGEPTTITGVKLRKTASAGPTAATDMTSKCPSGFVRISPGTFTMGSPEAEEGRSEDELQHIVTITRAYCMMAKEVTQGEWGAVMRTNPSRFNYCGSRCPVERVMWEDVIKYANALSLREGLPECYAESTITGLDCTGYRLPSEAEWEYAARAGTTGATYAGDLTIRGDRNGPELRPIAWFGGNSEVSYPGSDCSGWEERQYPPASCGTHPGGLKTPNAWGLYDMLGNVEEWTGDLVAAYTGTVTDPTGGVTGHSRVSRGGSWATPASRARAAVRGSVWLDRSGVIGFRLVRTAP